MQSPPLNKPHSNATFTHDSVYHRSYPPSQALIMFAKRILTAILLSANVVATVANHNAKYKGASTGGLSEDGGISYTTCCHSHIELCFIIPLVPGWQKVRHFQLCLNGTFDDPSTFTNSTYADTLHVVNCDQVRKTLRACTHQRGDDVGFFSAT